MTTTLCLTLWDFCKYQRFLVAWVGFLQELCIQVYWTLEVCQHIHCSTPRSLLSFGGKRRRPWIGAVYDAANETYATNTNILICFLFDLRIIEELCKSSLMVQESRSFVFFSSFMDHWTWQVQIFESKKLSQVGFLFDLVDWHKLYY